MTPSDLESVLGFIHLVADLILIPLLGLVWNIQGRISHIEGYIKGVDKDE